MADVEFSLIGVEKLSKTIEAVKYDIRRKGGRFALRKAANIVADALKQNAARLDDPTTGQKIADNVAVRFSSRAFKRTGNLVFRVGILKGAVLSKAGDKNANAPTPHWRLLEFGTEKMPAQPFARLAFERNIGQATSEFLTQYQKALDRAIKRAAKGA